MSPPTSPLVSLGEVAAASLDAIIVIDRHGMIQEWNRSAEAMFGWSRAEALGRLIHETVIPERLRSRHVNGIERFLETGESVILRRRLEVVGVRREGSEFPAELAVTVLGTGEERTFAAFIRDLSETKETERQLLEHQRRLAHVARFNTLGELASGIAHELNQPLTAIANSAALGLASDDPDEVRDSLHQIGDAVDLAGRLVQRFRNLAARSVTDRRPARMHDKLEEVLGLLSTQLAHARVELELDLCPDLPEVQVDDVQIQQVLLNLIHNACEAVAEMEKPRIRIDCERHVDKVVVGVENSGPRLTDESVFDAFHTSKPNGLGLGLSISRTIVEHHGGRIWLDTSPGPKSTRFCFSLPILAEEVHG